MNLESKQQTGLVNTILSLIKEAQDYSDDDMLLFKRINISNKDVLRPDVYYVRLETEDITLDFICTNIYGKSTVEETTFEE